VPHEQEECSLAGSLVKEKERDKTMGNVNANAVIQ
jgi:hypothetical protein